MVKNFNGYRITYHVFPDRVLALEVSSGILTESVSDQLRHGGLWVVGTAICEIVAGKSVLLGLNNSELDPRVVITAVCTSSLNENCSLSFDPECVSI